MESTQGLLSLWLRKFSIRFRNCYQPCGVRPNEGPPAGVVGNNRTRRSSVQKQRKVSFFDRRTGTGRVLAPTLSRQPVRGLLYTGRAGLWAGFLRDGRRRRRAAQAPGSVPAPPLCTRPTAAAILNCVSWVTRLTPARWGLGCEAPAHGPTGKCSWTKHERGGWTLSRRFQLTFPEDPRGL